MRLMLEELFTCLSFFLLLKYILIISQLQSKAFSLSFSLLSPQRKKEKHMHTWDFADNCQTIKGMERLFLSSINILNGTSYYFL